MNIVREFIISGFKLRTGGAVLGFAWTLLHPLLMLLILYMMFSRRIGAGIPHYGIFLLIGILYWNFFSRATTSSLRSIVAKRTMLKNAYVPVTAVVAGSVLETFLSFFLELLILGCFIIFSGIGFSWAAALLPFVILIELLLIGGVSLVLSCLNIYFKDMSYVWDIALKLGFFVTPVFYDPATLVSRGKLPLYLMNPLTQIMIFARDILLFKRIPNLMNMLFLFLFALSIFSIGYLIFKRFESAIVEKI
ncbi:MAG: ABC transporter permease [Candidatus Omnitrophota bacterium]